MSECRLYCAGARLLFRPTETAAGGQPLVFEVSTFAFFKEVQKSERPMLGKDGVRL